MGRQNRRWIAVEHTEAQNNNNAQDDDGYVYDYDDDFPISESPGPTKSKSKSYQVEYTSAYAKFGGKVDEEVGSCKYLGYLVLSPSIVTLLLRHSGWNKERLINEYIENPTQVLVYSGSQVPEPIPTPYSLRRR
ncbi:hypothetical protein DFH05DRAFT_1518590 [Lentinula detonsa]|uniref:E3 ubiquitin-protein ligase ARIH1-like UBA-like domain-containing protein n=1 Tax=Lentinula detonsa TaxID=2804962 RepID=A0A9W8PAT9_9AGAR|nr:hypothetical protein DFH05DRAFT_1518590 [Lentinula detonsa]